MSITTLLTSISTVIAATIAGWFAYLAHRAQSHNPETIAGGYSRLVTDMRAQVEDMNNRLKELELQRKEDRREIVRLKSQVSWFMARLTEEQHREFKALFGYVTDNS